MGQTWRPSFTRLAPNNTCDVLTGWNCWGGQQPWTLEALCIIFPYSTSVCLPASGLSTSVSLPASVTVCHRSVCLCLSACYRSVSLPATGLSVCLSACHRSVCLPATSLSASFCLPASGPSSSVCLLPVCLPLSVSVCLPTVGSISVFPPVCPPVRQLVCAHWGGGGELWVTKCFMHWLSFLCFADPR